MFLAFSVLSRALYARLGFLWNRVFCIQRAYMHVQVSSIANILAFVFLQFSYL